MKLFWKKYRIFYFVIFLIAACSTQENPNNPENMQSFIQEHGLEKYEYLFIIHISPKNCIGCLHPLEHLNKMHERISSGGENTFIAIASSGDDMFWNVYNSFQLTVPFLPEEELALLGWPDYKITPYCYFYDLKKHRLIYSDILPKEQVTFLALANLVEKYSGILF